MRAVFFDFDNTIYDDLSAIRRTFIVLRKEYRFMRPIPLDELISRFYFTDYNLKSLRENNVIPEKTNEIRTEKFLEMIGLPLRKEKVLEIHNRIRELHIKFGKLYPGVIPLLKYLKKNGYVLGIVTNHMSSYQQLKINATGIGSFFDFMVAAYDYNAFKPETKIFEIAQEICGVEKDNTVMIGDNWKADIEGAINYGISPIWVNFKNQPLPAEIDIECIRSFTPISEVVKKIEISYSKKISGSELIK